MDWDGWEEKCHKNHKRLPCCEDQMCPCDQEEFDRLQFENYRFRIALEKIANEDYRGPRPTSAIIAWKALEGK